MDFNAYFQPLSRLHYFSNYFAEIIDPTFSRHSARIYINRYQLNTSSSELIPSGRKLFQNMSTVNDHLQGHKLAIQLLSLFYVLIIVFLPVFSLGIVASYFFTEFFCNNAFFDLIAAAISENIFVSIYKSFTINY